MSQVNWGIVGAGNIAGSFVSDLLVNNSTDGEFVHRVVSIGCSSIEKGRAFIEKHGIVADKNGGYSVVAQLYDEFYQNPDIDVVYVASPHQFHKTQVIAALNNGKHVLVEKPICLTEKDTQELVDLAKSKSLFLMEAVWTRFFPLILQLKHLIFEKKVLGDLIRLFVDFSYDAQVSSLPPTSRVRDINLGASALLDIGVYSITYARVLLDQQLGKNHKKFGVKSFLNIDPIDKVDHSGSFLIHYADGIQAILTCNELSNGMKPFLRLEGTEATVEIYAENPACPLKSVITFNDNREPITYHTDATYKGFIYEANAVARDITTGKSQNDLMPNDESLLVMNIMDNIRYENNFRFPQEEGSK